MDKKKASIEVITVPSHILLACPYCDEEMKIRYTDFCDIAGEPCDWAYSSIDCPECQKSIDVDTVDWI